MNLENISYRVYTVCELREWLITNSANGLSEYCIAPARAYALINCPCAEDDDPALVVAFNGDKAIGYSAVYAEEFKKGNTKGRYFWGTTEWVDVEYRGKGIAGKMMRTLKEAVGVDRYLGLDSSIMSIKLDQKQGASILYYDRFNYQFSSRNSIKGRMLQWLIKKNNQKQVKALKQYAYTNRYVNYVDNETYQFIFKHSDKDLLLRKQEMFSWILNYPFLISTHGDCKSQTDICEFGSTVCKYEIEAVKVYSANQLVGFYIVSQTNQDRTLRYLYYDKSHQEEVLVSVTLNLLRDGVENIHFMSKDLQDFMSLRGIRHVNRKSYIDKIALTLPPGMTVDETLHIQGGDGDMFC